VHALTYTVGRNVAFGAGQYAPKTSAGQHLIVHESAHVAQQATEGAAPAAEELSIGTPGSRYEQAADRAAGTALARRQDAALQRLPNIEPTGSMLQRQAIGATEETDDFAAEVEPLPDVSGEGEPYHAVAFGLSLQGRTDANFRNRFKTVDVRATLGTGCTGCTGRSCVNATGTLESTYTVTTEVTLPRVSDFPDLTPCQQKRVRTAIDTDLAPHEQQHVRAYNTYTGTTRQPFSRTLCRNKMDSAMRTMHKTAEASRRAAAKAASAALDPFNVEVDLDCEDGPDAGMSFAPPDAGPVPAVPARGAAPVRTPTATISAMSFRGTANRIAPTRRVTVPITVNDLPTGSYVRVDVEGSGGANGTATVTSGTTLARSGDVTIRGGIQTTPGNAGNLRIRARVDGGVVGRSPGFTVAAFPINWTATWAHDVRSDTALGLEVQDGWESDGSGSVTELDQVKLTERVDVQSRDNPPFTSTGAISAAGKGTSRALEGNKLTTDTHAYGRAAINTAGLGFGTWRLVKGQLSLFNCRRTGVTNAVMPASGMTITHIVWNFAQAPGWKYRAVKQGAAITVEGRVATAGSGRAESSEYNL